MSNKTELVEKYEAELDRLRAEIRYRDATIRDQAERLRAAVGDGVRCERMVNDDPGIFNNVMNFGGGIDDERGTI